MKLLFLVSAAFLFSAVKGQLSDMSHWETLTDPQFFSTLRYPHQWTVDYLTEGYTLTSPKENDTDHYRENITFFAQPVPDGVMKTNIKDLAEASFIAIKKSLKEVRVMANRDITTRADMPMYLVVYNGLANGQYLYWKQVYCLYDNVSYVLTYTGEAGRKDPFAITGGDMLNSFAPAAKKQKL